MGVSFSQVPVNINSGDPNFPFPQFLEYEQGKSLALYNAEGVSHADMEQNMREAYQVMANRFRYTGDIVGGVQYIQGNLGCPYDCSEGDGYALLAAAYMGDRVTFNGLWMRIHDYKVTESPSYDDGSYILPMGTTGPNGSTDYRNGAETIIELENDGSQKGDAAADGDWDIGLALLVATKQWGAIRE